MKNNRGCPFFLLLYARQSIIYITLLPPLLLYLYFFPRYSANFLIDSEERELHLIFNFSLSKEGVFQSEQE